eukprot:12326738-Alexandrium_andersonii.AAC.1
MKGPCVPYRHFWPVLVEEGLSPVLNRRTLTRLCPFKKSSALASKLEVATLVRLPRVVAPALAILFLAG